MSYFDSLSSWQTAANNIQQHQQGVEQEANNAKASTIEEKFDAVDKYMNESGSGIGGLGGGIHLIRRMYTKVKSGQQKVQDAKDAYNKIKNKNNTPDGKSNNPDNENTDADGKTPDEHSKMNGTEDEPPSTDVSAPKPEQPPTADVDEESTVDTGVPKGGQQEMSDASDWAKAKVDEPPTTDTTPDVSTDGPQSQFFKDNPDIYEKLQNNPDLVEGVGQRQAEGTLGQKPPLNVEDTPLGENSLAEAPNPNTGIKSVPDAPDSTPTSAVGEAAEQEQNIKSAADAGSDVAKGALNGLKQGGQDLVDQTASTASKAASKATGFLSDATDATETIAKSSLDSALQTAGGVLDFLGPIGEVVGAGLALGSFFHDIFGSSSKKDSEDDASDSKTIIAQGTGISTTSMQTAATKSNVIGTLV